MINSIVQVESKVLGFVSGMWNNGSPSSTIVVWNSLRSIRMWCILLDSTHYVDRKNPCVIGGSDEWRYVKEGINTTSSMEVTIRCVLWFVWGVGNRVPEPFDDFHYAGECVWVYEIEGFWSTCEMSWVILKRSGDHHLYYCHCCCSHSVHRTVCVCQQASSGEAQFSSEPFVDRSREESVSRVVCPIFVKDASFYDPRNTSMLTSQRNSPHPRDTVQQPHLFSMFSLLVLTLLLAVVHSSIDDSWWWGPRMHHLFKRLF